MSSYTEIFQKALEALDRGVEEVKIEAESKGHQNSIKTTLHRERERRRKQNLLEMIESRIGISLRTDTAGGRFFVILYRPQSKIKNIIVKEADGTETRLSFDAPPNRELERIKRMMEKDGLCEEEQQKILKEKEDFSGKREKIEKLLQKNKTDEEILEEFPPEMTEEIKAIIGQIVQ